MKTRLLLFPLAVLLLVGCTGDEQIDINDFERERVIALADEYLEAEPVTVTAFESPRSAGGIHDFYSEGDYWWPDPENPEGPYIRRDGMSNPDNFVEHRKAMVRLSQIVPALTAAYIVTGDEKYARAAVRHLKAWFVNDETLMNPNLLYAQAISGRVTGRGVGIIDTIHLIEVARSIMFLKDSEALQGDDYATMRKWFDDYLTWMTTHEYGIDEMERTNNHGTCWVMQVAAFGELAERDTIREFASRRYKNVLVPNQIAEDGSYPLELRRTKPYGYSLFNLDAMATVCQIVSTDEDNLWVYSTPETGSMKEAMAYMYPYIKDKETWPLEPDVMYYDEWPIRHPALLFAGLALDKPEYVELWKTLEADPEVREVIRNYPIRQPVLWLNTPK